MSNYHSFKGEKYTFVLQKNYTDDIMHIKLQTPTQTVQQICFTKQEARKIVHYLNKLIREAE